MKIVIFGPKMAKNGPKRTKMGQKWVKNGFSSNIVVLYIVEKLLAKRPHLLQQKIKFFIFEPKMAQNDQKDISAVNRISI